MSQKVETTKTFTIDDYTAKRILELCKKIKVANGEAYEERFRNWHLQTYGCLPEENERQNITATQ